MSDKVEQDAGVFDLIKWALVVAIVGAGIVANSMYADQVAPLYRALAGVGVAIVAGGLAYFTVKGKAFVTLLKEARVEVKKVVWPTRTETSQSTMIVVVFVFIMSLILWGLDSLLAATAKLLIG